MVDDRFLLWICYLILMKRSPYDVITSQRTVWHHSQRLVYGRGRLRLAPADDGPMSWHVLMHGDAAPRASHWGDGCRPGTWCCSIQVEGARSQLSGGQPSHCHDNAHGHGENVSFIDNESTGLHLQWMFAKRNMLKQSETIPYIWFPLYIGK